MLFKVTNKDNKGNSVFIQGSYSRNTTNDVSSVTFQNYDDDSKSTYNIARISSRDAYGNCNLNGYGELLFMTNGDGSNLSERMRIKSSGYICMGMDTPLNDSLLSINGSTSIANDLNVGQTANLSSLIVSSNVTVSNDLHVLQHTIVNGNLTTTSNLYVYDDVDIFGAANIRNRLTVHGGIIIKRNSNITTSNDSSEITLSNDLRILEDGIIQGTLDVSSNVSFNNGLTVSGNVIFRSNLDLYQSITIDGIATVHNALIVNSNAIIGKDAILAGNLTTMSDVTLGGSTSSNAINVNGRTTITANHSNYTVIVNQTGTGNLMSIQKNGVNKLVALNNGNIGIGTSNPSKLLEVNGDVNFIGNIYKNNNLLQSSPVILSFPKVRHTSKSYKSILSWINNSKSIDSMYVRSYITANTYDDVNNLNFNYKLRVYDATNNIVLHTSTHSNQSSSNLLLTLSNVTSNAIVSMELHSQVGLIGNYVCIENVLLNYN
jgi:predicted acyltransferase (DUF342 family)